MSARDMKRDCKIFCGGLDRDRPVHEDDIRYAFKKYGRVRSIWVARRPPGFCYVEMESPSDAEEACRKLDGTKARFFQILLKNNRTIYSCPDT